MNKIILIFLVFICSTIGAQNTIATSKKEKMKFSQKEIVIDTANIKERKFNKNFKTKYTDSDFVYEFKTPEKNAWDRFKEWLVNILKNVFRFSDNTLSKKTVDYIIQTIALLIVVYVIYLITKAYLNNEGQWIFGRNSDKKLISYDEIEKNIHIVNFEKLIQKSTESDQKRLTIRYYYLWLLKIMSEKQIIEWDVEKTNSDYLYEIKDQSKKKDFAYLSYIYNNIWYGEFELNEAKFITSKNAFEKSIRLINNE